MTHHKCRPSMTIVCRPGDTHSFLREFSGLEGEALREAFAGLSRPQLFEVMQNLANAPKEAAEQLRNKIEQCDANVQAEIRQIIYGHVRDQWSGQEMLSQLSATLLAGYAEADFAMAVSDPAMLRSLVQIEAFRLEDSALTMQDKTVIAQRLSRYGLATNDRLVNRRTEAVLSQFLQRPEGAEFKQCIETQLEACSTHLAQRQAGLARQIERYARELESAYQAQNIDYQDPCWQMPLESLSPRQLRLMRACSATDDAALQGLADNVYGQYNAYQCAALDLSREYLAPLAENALTKLSEILPFRQIYFTDASRRRYENDVAANRQLLSLVRGQISEQSWDLTRTLTQDMRSLHDAMEPQDVCHMLASSLSVLSDTQAMLAQIPRQHCTVRDDDYIPYDMVEHVLKRMPILQESFREENWVAVNASLQSGAELSEAQALFVGDATAIQEASNQLMLRMAMRNSRAYQESDLAHLGFYLPPSSALNVIKEMGHQLHDNQLMDGVRLIKAYMAFGNIKKLLTQSDKLKEDGEWLKALYKGAKSGFEVVEMTSAIALRCPQQLGAVSQLLRSSRHLKAVQKIAGRAAMGMSAALDGYDAYDAYRQGDVQSGVGLSAQAAGGAALIVCSGGTAVVVGGVLIGGGLLYEEVWGDTELERAARKAGYTPDTW